MELIFQSIMFGAVAVYNSTKNSTEIWCKFPRKIIKHTHRPKCEYLYILLKSSWLWLKFCNILLKNSEVMRFCWRKKFGDCICISSFLVQKPDDHRILQINVRRILIAQINRLIICYLRSKPWCAQHCAIIQDMYQIGATKHVLSTPTRWTVFLLFFSLDRWQDGSLLSLVAHQLYSTSVLPYSPWVIYGRWQIVKWPNSSSSYIGGSGILVHMWVFDLYCKVLNTIFVSNIDKKPITRSTRLKHSRN